MSQLSGRQVTPAKHRQRCHETSNQQQQPFNNSSSPRKQIAVVTPEPRIISLGNRDKKKSEEEDSSRLLLHFLTSRHPATKNTIISRAKLISPAAPERLSHEEGRGAAAMECLQCGRLHRDQKEFLLHLDGTPSFKSSLLEERAALAEIKPSATKSPSMTLVSLLQCRGCGGFVSASDRSSVAEHIKNCIKTANDKECAVCGKKNRKRSSLHELGGKSCLKYLNSKMMTNRCSRGDKTMKQCRICLDETTEAEEMCRQCVDQVSSCHPVSVSRDEDSDVPRECVTCSSRADLRRFAFDRGGVAYDVTFCGQCCDMREQRKSFNDAFSRAVNEFVDLAKCA